MKTPSKCRACGSSDLIWFILRNTGGAQGEPLRMPEIAYDFILGCKECSETLRVLRAEDVAEYLTLLRTLPARQGAEEHEAVEVVGYLNESGTYYPSMDSVERYAPPGEQLQQLMTVTQHERTLPAQERAQSAAVSGAQAAQSASDDVFEEGQWWLEELDSIVANGTPTQRRAMAVVRNLLSCWQRVQAAAVPKGWSIQRVFNPSGYTIQMPDGGFLRITDFGGGGVETAFAKFICAMLANAEQQVGQESEPAPKQHPDDAAVDRFAAAMKAKLARSREKGRHGWQNCTAPHLSAMLYDHLYKADPLDVGNFAMMLHQNGQAIELPFEARGRHTAPPARASSGRGGVG